MSDVLHLTEYEEQSVALDREDAEYLAREFGQSISIRRDFSGDRYIVNPNQFVGVLSLPSGTRLELVPKVPVGTLFYMLAVAFDLPSPFKNEQMQFDELDELIDVVVSYFADVVEERIRLGLYRSYVENEDNLGAIRGRIAIAEDVRRNHVLRHRTYCRFTEFTWDIPENQIIRQVVHLLGGWVHRPELRLRLRRIDRLLSEVSPARLSARVLDQIAYHRLNEDYRPIHQLCRLFLEGASLSESEGIFTFRTFLLDMNRLFEVFVTQALRDRARPPITVHDQERLFLGYDKTLPMRADIFVRFDGTAALIADCKYKRPEVAQFHEHDVYQLLAYCTAANLPRGLLIYPRHIVAVDDEVRVRNSAVRIRRASLDLSGSPIELRGACDGFFTQVLDWSKGKVWSPALFP